MISWGVTGLVPTGRFALAALAVFGAAEAAAGRLEVALTVLDPETFETRAPEGRIEWRLQGPGTARAETTEAEPRAAFDLEPGRWEALVWEAETRAASRFTAQVPEAGVASVAALLSPTAAGLIPAEPAPAADSAASAPGTTTAAEAPSSPPAAEAFAGPASAARPAPAAPPAALSTAIPPLEIVRAFAPGAVFSVRLPAVEDWANDIVVIIGGGPGRRATIVRGDRGAVDLVAPERAGVYRVEYIAIPEEAVLARTEIMVE